MHIQRHIHHPVSSCLFLEHGIIKPEQIIDKGANIDSGLFGLSVGYFLFKNDVLITMLKSVKDFIDLLENTFQKGACTCMRCVSDEAPSNQRCV